LIPPKESYIDKSLSKKGPPLFPYSFNSHFYFKIILKNLLDADDRSSSDLERAVDSNILGGYSKKTKKPILLFLFPEFFLLLRGLLH
jgi:hypothetical protein